MDVTGGGQSGLMGPGNSPAQDLISAAQRRPNHPALVFDGGSWSYSKLLDEAESVARVLGPPPAPDRNRVAVEGRPAPDRIAALYGAWLAGWIVVPVHHKLTPAEHDAVLSAFRPEARLLEDGSIERTSTDELTSGAGVGQAGVGQAGVGQAGVGQAAAALIQSSGTTGSPRGILLSRSNLRTSAAGAQDRLGLTGDDVWGLVLSVAHVGGLALVTRAVSLACSVRIWSPFDAGLVAQAVVDGDVSHLSLVPVMLDQLVEALEGPPDDFFSLVLTGGARTEPSLVERAQAKGVRVALTYGMSEACSQIATAPPELVHRKPGTVGAPLAGLEIALGEGGEIRVRGGTVALGVVEAKEIGVIKPLVDSEGWLNTGDLGEIDEDGHLWVTGRQEGRIVTGGSTVDPAEVEDVVSAAPGVRSACVVGWPDPIWGEVVVAFVVMVSGDGIPDPNVPVTAGLGEVEAQSIAAIDAHCRSHLTRAKCPSQIILVGEFPRNRNGKVVRSRLLELIEADM